LVKRTIEDARRLSVSAEFVNSDWAAGQVPTAANPVEAGLRNEFESLWNGGMPRVSRQLRLAWKAKSLFRAAWRMGASERRLDNKQTIVQFMDYLKSKVISDDVLLFIWKKHIEKDFSAGNKDLMTKDAKAILDEARRLQATHHPENGIPRAGTRRVSRRSWRRRRISCTWTVSAFSRPG
jgi:hypothetical protein